eukprot:CAMPEP_0171196308 /NCGR_PEP_ID=MMETSP0790-20130122/21836_1 /TAXON_ID=2925 /ORGANISM="Alexandrium catenella, Strain OF101" /LENGTH=38 /DNA_ID= /DNA_START= /DNA_END= /DNA_ORIENTATION=
MPPGGGAPEHDRNCIGDVGRPYKTYGTEDEWRRLLKMR